MTSPGPMILMPLFVEAALGILLHEIAALAAGHEHEHRVGSRIRHSLQERRKIGIHQAAP